MVTSVSTTSVYEIPNRSPGSGLTPGQNSVSKAVSKFLEISVSKFAQPMSFEGARGSFGSCAHVRYLYDGMPNAAFFDDRALLRINKLRPFNIGPLPPRAPIRGAERWMERCATSTRSNLIRRSQSASPFLNNDGGASGSSPPCADSAGSRL